MTRGGRWATALVLLGFGAAVVLVIEGITGVPAPGAYLTGAGLGAVAAAALDRAGFDVDPLSVAAAIVVVGLLVALAPLRPDLLARAETYAVLVGLVGAGNVLLALRDRPRGGRGGRSRRR